MLVVDQSINASRKAGKITLIGCILFKNCVITQMLGNFRWAFLWKIWRDRGINVCWCCGNTGSNIFAFPVGRMLEMTSIASPRCKGLVAGRAHHTAVSRHSYWVNFKAERARLVTSIGFRQLHVHLVRNEGEGSSSFVAHVLWGQNVCVSYESYRYGYVYLRPRELVDCQVVLTL